MTEIPPWAQPPTIPPGYDADPPPGQANAAVVEANLRAAFTRLRQIRDADPVAFGNLTAAQRDTQLFLATQDVARYMIWLGRLLLFDVHDGTD